MNIELIHEKQLLTRPFQRMREEIFIQVFEWKKPSDEFDRFKILWIERNINCLAILNAGQDMIS